MKGEEAIVVRTTMARDKLGVSPTACLKAVGKEREERGGEQREEEREESEEEGG